MKIIDFETKGNVIRFALGADDCNDYWGDDWDNVPYEHNAGSVYDEYICATTELYVPFNFSVCVPADDWHYRGNSPFSKKDFKNGIAPCLVIDVSPDCNTCYSHAALKKDSIKFYFNLSMNPGTYEVFKNGILYPLHRE